MKAENVTIYSMIRTIEVVPRGVKTLSKYRMKSFRTGVTYTVPEKFFSDFATVPKLLRPFLHPSGRIRAGALIHDYLYSTEIVSKKVADKILFDCARARGISVITSHLIYWGVKFFGKPVWK